MSSAKQVFVELAYWARETGQPLAEVRAFTGVEEHSAMTVPTGRVVRCDSRVNLGLAWWPEGVDEPTAKRGVWFMCDPDRAHAEAEEFKRLVEELRTSSAPELGSGSVTADGDRSE